MPAIWHDPLGLLHDATGTSHLSAVPWTRHADVAPTILQWAGYRVADGAWQGTAVRPGLALGPPASAHTRGPGGECLALFSFADADGARAVACGADGGLSYSLSDPLRHGSVVVHQSIVINATVRPAGVSTATLDVAGGHGDRHGEAERVRQELSSLYASWRAATAATPSTATQRAAVTSTATEEEAATNASNASTARRWAEKRVALRSCIARLNADAHRTLPASHIVHTCTKCAASRHRVWPAFLVLGARGTDVAPLFLQMMRHPRVLPPKKMHPGSKQLGGRHFFGSALYSARNRSLLRTCCSYLASFPSPRDGKPACLRRGLGRAPLLCRTPNASTGSCYGDGYVSGDATPAALTGAIPAVVRGLLPAARLVVLARCPVERLFAHAAARMKAGAQGKGLGRVPWHQVLRQAEAEATSLSQHHHVPGGRPWPVAEEGLVAPGMYVRWLQYWAADWGRGRLQLLFAEELQAAAAAGETTLRAFLAPVIHHVGLDAAAIDDPVGRRQLHTEPAASSAPPSGAAHSIVMPARRVALEAAVCSLYRRANTELEAWHGRRHPTSWRCGVSDTSSSLGDFTTENVM